MCANQVRTIPVSAFLVAVLGIALAAPTPSLAAESPASAPAPGAAPAAQEKPKPKPKRAAAKRAPKAAPEAAAVVAARPVINPKYNDVMTPVLMRDHAGAAEILQAGAWADRADSNGETPLMLAAKQGDPKMTALLLQHGANPNRSGPAGNLHAYAGLGGSGEVVKLITKAGAR
jgi:ankyrin repeat protein